MPRNNDSIMQELRSVMSIDVNFLYEIIDPDNNIVIADEIFICDGNGIVVQISDTYETNFGFARESIIGQSVFDLEARGVFQPCISATVLRTRKKVIRTQLVQGKHAVLATGLPVFDQNQSLRYVVVFNTITMEHVKNLRSSIDQYAAELKELRQKITAHPDIVVKSKHMQDIWETVRQSMDTKVNVLITGETGVGKGMIARAMHSMSSRAAKPFIEINCGVIHENLIESELFGYEKGAFTGASKSGKLGKIELANEGTLFLDEIGELPLHVQTKLLQLIQDKTVERISSNKKIQLDIKLICATNRELEKEVEAGRFRKDLFYRLNVLEIHIPPLRERRDDICHLTLQFLHHFNEEYQKNKRISPELMSFLECHPLPGNVRQLENLIERLVITSAGRTIEVSDLPRDMLADSGAAPAISGGTLPAMLEEYERQIVLRSYAAHKTTVAVAKDLGISQATAVRKLMKYVKGADSGPAR